MIQYRTVDISTVKGQREAERLQRNGWECYHVGFFLQYWRKTA